MSVIANDTNYNSFPGFCVAANGDLVAAYRVGTTHTEGNGGIVRKISTDGGATWGAASTVVSDASFDYCTAVMAVLSDERIVLVTWRRPATGGTPSTGQADAVRVMFSSDNGATFGAENVISGAFDAKCIAEAPVVEDANGDLLLPVWGRDADYTGNNHSVKLLKSTDGGLTWPVFSTIVNGQADGKWYNETGIFEYGGTWYALIREENGYALLVSESTDGGLTWSAPVGKMPTKSRYQGAPRPVVLPAFGGLAYSFWRPLDADSRAMMLVTDGETFTSPLRVYGTGGKMLYAQADALSASQIGVVHSVENSSTDADVLFTKINVTT